MPSIMVTISAQIPLEHCEAIDEAVKNGEHKNRSDFIRKAVKKKLEE